MEVSYQLHIPTALLPGKCLLLTWVRGLGGPQNQSGRCGIAKSLLPVPGNEPRPSSVLPIAILTELSRLPLVVVVVPVVVVVQSPSFASFHCPLLAPFVYLLHEC
jgi:hypothetical protein